MKEAHCTALASGDGRCPPRAFPTAVLALSWMPQLGNASGTRPSVCRNRPLIVVRLDAGRPLDDEPVACRGRLRDGYRACAMSRLRNDFKTRSASRAAVKSRMAAMKKTSFQLPVPAGSRFAIGTTRAAVPLAV